MHDFKTLRFSILQGFKKEKQQKLHKFNTHTLIAIVN